MILQLNIHKGSPVKEMVASNGTARWAVLYKVDRLAILNSTCREEQLYLGVAELGRREVGI